MIPIGFLGPAARNCSDASFGLVGVGVGVGVELPKRGPGFLETSLHASCRVARRGRGCVGGVMALVIILFTRRWSAAYTNLRNLVLPLLLRLGPGTAPLRESVGSMPYGLAIALSTLWLLAQRHLP